MLGVILTFSHSSDLILQIKWVISQAETSDNYNYRKIPV